MSDYGQATTAATPKSTLTNTIDEFDAIKERLYLFSNQLCSIADRICGAIPAEVRNIKETPPAPSLISAAQYKLSDLRHLCNDIENHIHRIGNAL